MFYPRIQKIFRDLWNNKSRTIIVILAIAVGVFSFGSVFTTRQVLLTDMDVQYRATHPSAIAMNIPSFDESLVSWIKSQPEISDAQARNSNLIKAIVDDKKENLVLISYKNYAAITLNQVDDIVGTFPPGKDEIVLERASLPWIKKSIGDTIDLELADSSIKRFTIVGTVHDLSSFPPNLAIRMTGYVSWQSLGDLGFSPNYNELLIAPSAKFQTLSQSQGLSDTLKTRLENRGWNASIGIVTEPGKHWAKDVMNGFVTILEAIGVFSLLLSGFLVITTITGVITQQRSQIGIMKAIGATVPQITGLYLAMVSIYGLLALAIAIPVGMGLSYMNIKALVSFLNLDILHFYLPPEVLILEITAAVAVPLLSAFVPILTGSRITVREAIYSQGIGAGKTSGFMYRVTSSIAAVSRPIILSVRNTFRKRGRLFLTLGTLTFAGAFFICVVNVRSSLLTEINNLFKTINFDIELNFDKPYDLDTVSARIMTIPQVETVEGRTMAQAKAIKPDGSSGTTFPINGLPAKSDFIDPSLQKGRWLTPGAPDEIVVATEFTREEPEVDVGQDMTVEIGNRKHVWHVVGILFSSFGDKTAYADFSELTRVQNLPPDVSSLFLRLKDRTPGAREDTVKEAEALFKKWDIGINQSLTRDALESSIGGRISFLVSTLLFMALLIALVGGLGLAGTMSLNILERTREIGVMRSLGASNFIVQLLVIAEGLFIGIMSFLLSLPISVPVSYGFDYILGKALFQMPLTFVYSFTGVAIWFIIIVFISIIASILSARRAAHLTVRETLAYE